jgi:hypothetical protein
MCVKIPEAFFIRLYGILPRDCFIVLDRVLNQSRPIQSIITLLRRYHNTGHLH